MTQTSNLSRAASAALLLGMAALATTLQAAPQGPVPGTWLMLINGHRPAYPPGTFFDDGRLLLAATTLPKNDCTAGPVEIGAGHGQWSFRSRDRRLRWSTVHKLTGQEAWVISASGVVQQGPNGPVFNGSARLTTYLDADALQQGTPSCTTQVPVSGYSWDIDNDGN